MKVTFMIIITFMLSSIFSLKYTPKPKFCINCKHFIQDISKDPEYGKCTLFKNNIISVDTDFLVTGNNKLQEVNYYYYCSTARTSDDMCGKSGKMYKRKIIRKEKNKKNNL